MAKRSPSTPITALDPHHPLIRRLTRAVQLRDRMLGVDERSAVDAAGCVGRLGHIGHLVALTAAHLATARPRGEHDEAAQELLAFDGAPIGRLRRPATTPDLLLPAYEAALEQQFAGDDGREGDADQVAECADVDMEATVAL